MTLREREVGDVTILDIDGRIAIQDGVDPLRVVLRQLFAMSRVKLVFNLPVRISAAPSDHPGARRLPGAPGCATARAAAGDLLGVRWRGDDREAGEEAGGH
jgi:hypothetical protein